MTHSFPTRRSSDLDGRPKDGVSYGALWLTPEGNEMTESDWTFPDGRFLSYVMGPMEPGGAAIFIVLNRSEEHTSELQSLMRISYAVFCLKKKINRTRQVMYNVYYTSHTTKC